MKDYLFIYRSRLTIFIVLLIISGACSYTKRYVFLNVPDVYDYKKLPSREIALDHTYQFSFKKDTDFNLNSILPLKFNTTVVSDLDSFLEQSGTTAFIVIRNDSILAEKYYNNHFHHTLCKSFSVSKVFLSALIGVAIEEGFIKSVNDSVMKYIPEIKDKRFNGLTINHCLSLSSGIKTNNREIFPWNDKVKLYYSNDIRKFITGIKYSKEPGNEFFIEEISPVILGFVLERATGKSISEYLSEKIWKPLGMESNALWVVDNKSNGFEAANSGLTALAIDFAKFGRLYLNHGNWNGKQIIPKSWIDNTTCADSTRISFYKAIDYYEKRDVYFNSMWWGLRKNYTIYEYSANGHFGQRIYIVPHKNIVVLRFGSKDGNIDWTSFIMKLVEEV